MISIPKSTSIGKPPKMKDAQSGGAALHFGVLSPKMDAFLKQKLNNEGNWDSYRQLSEHDANRYIYQCLDPKATDDERTAATKRLLEPLTANHSKNTAYNPKGAFILLESVRKKLASAKEEKRSVVVPEVLILGLISILEKASAETRRLLEKGGVAPISLFVPFKPHFNDVLDTKLLEAFFRIGNGLTPPVTNYSFTPPYIKDTILTPFNSIFLVSVLDYLLSPDYTLTPPPAIIQDVKIRLMGLVKDYNPVGEIKRFKDPFEGVRMEGQYPAQKAITLLMTMRDVMKHAVPPRDLVQQLMDIAESATELPKDYKLYLVDPSMEPRFPEDLEKRYYRIILDEKQTYCTTVTPLRVLDQLLRRYGEDVIRPGHSGYPLYDQVVKTLKRQVDASDNRQDQLKAILKLMDNKIILKSLAPDAFVQMFLDVLEQTPPNPEEPLPLSSLEIDRLPDKVMDLYRFVILKVSPRSGHETDVELRNEMTNRLGEIKKRYDSGPNEYITQAELDKRTREALEEVWQDWKSKKSA